MLCAGVGSEVAAPTRGLEHLEQGLCFLLTHRQHLVQSLHQADAHGSQMLGDEQVRLQIPVLMWP